jgi:hypothetical protein
MRAIMPKAVTGYWAGFTGTLEDDHCSELTIGVLDSE